MKGQQFSSFTGTL